MLHQSCPGVSHQQALSAAATPTRHMLHNQKLHEPLQLNKLTPKYYASRWTLLATRLDTW